MDLALSDELYARYRDLLRDRCGLHYPERKRGDLAHALAGVLRITGHTSAATLYADMLAGGPAWDIALEQLTIGETYFFRNGPQFEALQQTIIPELVARRAPLHSLRLWSAGCATGEEPYSLAMLLSQLLPAIDEWQVTILATDLNPAFLKRAREATYGSWSFRETSEAQREQFFTPEEGRWRVRPEIRRRVTFQRLNLAEPTYPSVMNGTCAIDLLLCRNVMIYFDEATTRQVVDRFYAALAPGGWLIVGHAEPQASVYARFETHNFPGTIVYRKPLDAPLFGYDPRRGTFTAGASPILEPGLERARAAAKAVEPIARRAEPAVAPPAKGPEPAATTAAPREAAPAPDRWPAIVARLRQGEKRDAERLIGELLEREPQHVAALAALARLCADRGDLEAGRRWCEEALRHDPLQIEAHHTLALIDEQLGNLDAALSSYRRTVYLDAGFVMGTIGMANIWRVGGHLADARRGYRSALRQLSALDPAAAVPGAEGATAGDLASAIAQQLRAIE